MIATLSFESAHGKVKDRWRLTIKRGDVVDVFTHRSYTEAAQWVDGLAWASEMVPQAVVWKGTFAAPHGAPLCYTYEAAER